MPFISTRNPELAPVSLARALRQGLADDGGLFFPASLEPLTDGFLANLPGMDPAEVAKTVATHLLAGEIPTETVEKIATSALDFPMPLRQLSDRVRILELFHGPTLAFKDVGARFLARLLPAVGRESADLTVLVATSGDTGGAVAQAFHGVPGTRVAVLYPRGKVSPLQERQFSTLGGNVLALAVDGTFDDCQRLVKRAFGERELARRLHLTSANSINVGRLLPQVIYYFTAVAALGEEASRPRIFVTPSGNFGNLTAGLIAHALGLEAKGFVAATNANDVVPEYLLSGIFQPRPSLATLSNAMDVGNPSNFDRILHLYGGDLESIRQILVGSRHSDDETRQAIASVWKQHTYLLDPHTAVGYLALEGLLPKHGDDTLGIVLGTAHPAKFAEAVEPTLGHPIPLPEALSSRLDLPILSQPMEASFGALRTSLETWVG